MGKGFSSFFEWHYGVSLADASLAGSQYWGLGGDAGRGDDRAVTCSPDGLLEGIIRTKRLRRCRRFFRRTRKKRLGAASLLLGGFLVVSCCHDR